MFAIIQNSIRWLLDYYGRYTSFSHILGFIIVVLITLPICTSKAQPFCTPLHHPALPLSHPVLILPHYFVLPFLHFALRNPLYFALFVALFRTTITQVCLYYHRLYTITPAYHHPTSLFLYHNSSLTISPAHHHTPAPPAYATAHSRDAYQRQQLEAFTAELRKED